MNCLSGFGWLLLKSAVMFPKKNMQNDGGITEMGGRTLTERKESGTVSHVWRKLQSRRRNLKELKGRSGSCHGLEGIEIVLFSAHSLVAQSAKNPAAMQEPQILCMGREDPLEKEMITRFRILAWEIPWTELDTTEWLNHNHQLNKEWKLCMQKRTSSKSLQSFSVHSALQKQILGLCMYSIMSSSNSESFTFFLFWSRYLLNLFPSLLKLGLP